MLYLGYILYSQVKKASTRGCSNISRRCQLYGQFILCMAISHAGCESIFKYMWVTYFIYLLSITYFLLMFFITNMALPIPEVDIACLARLLLFWFLIRGICSYGLSSAQVLLAWTVKISITYWKLCIAVKSLHCYSRTVAKIVYGTFWVNRIHWLQETIDADEFTP